MKKIIYRIRKKSEEDRRSILHLFIFFAAVVLILLWVYSLGNTLTDPDTATKIEKDLSPFSTLKDNLTSPW